MSIEEVKKQRAARKEAAAKDQAEQEEKDLLALNDLEIEHGDSSVGTMRVERFVPGNPMTIVFKAPSKAQYKRFCDQVAASMKKNDTKSRQDAQDLLSNSVWVYPKESSERDAMLEAFPGLLLSIAIEAQKLVEAKKVEEGKD